MVKKKLNQKKLRTKDPLTSAVKFKTVSKNEDDGSSPSSAVNAPNTLGETPLAIACRLGRLDVVRYFVEKCQANINQTSLVTFQNKF